MNKVKTLKALVAAAVMGVAIKGVSFAQAPPVPSEPPAAPVAVKTGSLEVTVTIPGVKSLKSAVIYASNQERTITSFSEPVRIDDIPVGRMVVIAEAGGSAAVMKSGRRYLGATEVHVQENTAQKVTVTVEKSDNIDEFCLRCHPNARDPKVKVLPGQIVRDIHTSGKEFPAKFREKYMTQWKAHTEAVERLEKEGKPHNMPMPLTEKLVKVGGKEVKRVLYTCETCHTLHLKTPWEYERAPFKNKPDLCVACHF